MSLQQQNRQQREVLEFSHYCVVCGGPMQIVKADRNSRRPRSWWCEYKCDCGVRDSSRNSIEQQKNRPALRLAEGGR